MSIKYKHSQTDHTVLQPGSNVALLILVCNNSIQLWTRQPTTIQQITE